MADKIKTHKDLDLWKESIELVKKVYKITSNFPEKEVFGLISQIKRAAVSITSNIAEGAARNSRKEFIQFLYISLGSCAELDTQLIISKELGFLKSENSVFDDLERIKIKFLGLIKFLKKSEETKREK